MRPWAGACRCHGHSPCGCSVAPARRACHHRACVQPGFRRRLDRQCRLACDCAVFRGRRREPVVGDQRLFAAFERAAVARRCGRRSFRPSALVVDGRGLVRRGVAAVRRGARAAVVDCRARAARRGRGDADARQPGDSGQQLLRRRAWPRHRHLGRGRRGCGRHRPVAGRMADRCRGLARDVPGQHADRRRSARLCAALCAGRTARGSSPARRGRRAARHRRAGVPDLGAHRCVRPCGAARLVGGGAGGRGAAVRAVPGSTAAARRAR